MIYYAAPQIMTKLRPAELQFKIGKNHAGKYHALYYDLAICNMTRAQAEESTVVTDAQAEGHPAAKRMLWDFVTSVTGRFNTKSSPRPRAFPRGWTPLSKDCSRYAEITNADGFLQSYQVQVINTGHIPGQDRAFLRERLGKSNAHFGTWSSVSARRGKVVLPAIVTGRLVTQASLIRRDVQ